MVTGHLLTNGVLKRQDTSIKRIQACQTISRETAGTKGRKGSNSVGTHMTWEDGARRSFRLVGAKFADG